MSKKAFIIFIVLLLVIMGAVGWYFFKQSEATPNTVGETTEESSDLFPFGKKPTETTTGSLVTEPVNEVSTSTIDLGSEFADVLPRLRQISMAPTAGAVAWNIGSTTIFRYIDRATGHIYETTSESLDVKKISNTTIPKIYEALWTNDGSKLLIRYIKDNSTVIRTFYAKIATTTKPEQAIEGIFLADGIKEISISGNKIFYMSENTSGSNGVLANIDGSNKNSVFSSSFSDWRSSLSSQTTAVLFSKPSNLSLGSAYYLNTTNSSYFKIPLDLNGTVAKGNSDNSRILVSAIQNNGLVTMVFDVKKSTLENLGVQTIADKCVWSLKDKNIVFCAVPQFLPNGSYPDDWYKGKISFNDNLWRIDVVSGETENIFDPELETGISMDMVKLSLNKEETVLLFTNKKDMTVWSYRLVE